MIKKSCQADHDVKYVRAQYLEGRGDKLGQVFRKILESCE